MNITTIFYADPNGFSKGIVHLSKDESFHLIRSLRYRAGDKFIITNGKSEAWWAELTKADEKYAIANLLDEKLPHLSQELPIKLTCAVGIIRPKRFEAMLEMLVHLGVSEIVPISTRYCNPTFIKRLGGAEYQRRMNRILIAGMKSSLRTQLPIIHQPIELFELFREKRWDSIYYGDTEGLPQVREAQSNDRVMLLTGPEGGFNHREIETIRSMNGIPIVLGRTRLRTETAAVALTVKSLDGMGLL